MMQKVKCVEVKEHKVSQSNKFRLVGELVPYQQLVNYFGNDEAAQTYADSCHAKASDWVKWSKMANCTLFSLVKNVDEEENKMERNRRTREVVCGLVSGCQHDRERKESVSLPRVSMST